MTHIFFSFNVYPSWCVLCTSIFNSMAVPMVVLATNSVQFGNGMVCEATHIVGDCLFSCNGKEWSFSGMLAEERSFDDIAKTVVTATADRESLSQFMLDNYYDYQAYNHI